MRWISWIRSPHFTLLAGTHRHHTDPVYIDTKRLGIDREAYCRSWKEETGPKQLTIEAPATRSMPAGVLGCP